MIALWVILCLILIYGIYGPLMELIFHIWHIGTFYRGNSDARKVCLTFDDGPDERYTPQVLDILKAHGVKATFFMIGTQAERDPVLVQRIIEEGHEIGSHSYQHQHAWLRDPLGTWRDIRKSKLTLERLIGQRVRFYRPPWGAFNVITRVACSFLGLTPVLWSHRAVDWLPGEYADEVVSRVVRPSVPGSVVLCHDATAAGAPDSPLNTIAALPTIIEQLHALGFRFATVGELFDAVQDRAARPRPYTGYPAWRRGLIAVWRLVEWAFARIYHITAVDEMFRLSPMVWHFGQRRNPESGAEVLRDGARAMDLHFQNETLIAVSNEGDNKALIRALKQTKNGLKDLARMVQFHPDYQDVQVFCAVTLMNRGIEMLGFHVEDLPNTRENRRLQRYMKFLMGMYHPEGFARLREGAQSLTLRLVWMTRDEVVQRYGDGG